MDRLIQIGLVSCLLWCGSGCSLFKNDKLEFYQSENDRLIREYREQRDLASRLEVQNRALVGRVSQLEGKLAAITDAVRDPLMDMPQRYPNSFQGIPASTPLTPTLQQGGTALPPATDPWKPTGTP